MPKATAAVHATDPDGRLRHAKDRLIAATAQLTDAKYGVHQVRELLDNSRRMLDDKMRIEWAAEQREAEARRELKAAQMHHDVARLMAESAARRAGCAKCVFGADIMQAIYAFVLLHGDTLGGFEGNAIDWVDYAERFDPTLSSLLDVYVQLLRAGAPLATGAPDGTGSPDATGSPDGTGAPDAIGSPAEQKQPPA